MPRGVITFVFDDGYQHILEDVVPILNHHNVKGVFAIPLEPRHIEQTEGLPVASSEAWRAVTRDGHEIAAHGITHRALPTVTAHELSIELAKPAAELSATTLVYPGGAYTDAVVTMAKKHYAAARTTVHGFASTKTANRYTLPTVNYTRRNWSLWKANTRALVALLTDQWLIETFHIVSDQDTAREHSVPLRDFKRHVAFVAALPISIQTIHETLRNNNH